MKAGSVALVLGGLLALQGCEREPVRTVVHGPARPPEAAGRGMPAPPPAARSARPGDATAAPTTRGDPGDAEGAQLLARRTLRLPVPGVAASALVDTYTRSRGPRPHAAIDILAPRGTPVVAVEDGRIARLFTSKPGGLTVYHFDPEGRLAYYYAHLDRYAEGLKEGMQVRRGDVLGYVGSTGNADARVPHLHFAVFRLGPERRWWEGEPVNPYLALRAAEPATVVTASR